MVGRFLAARAAGALLATLAFVPACGGHSTQTTSPACEPAPAGVGPDAAGTLQVEDAARTVCLAAGAVLTVYLKVPLEEESTRWGPVTTSDGGVLEVRSTGVQTLVRGVTGGIFVGRKPGVATLRSTRPNCSSAQPCDPVRRWEATVVVRRA